MMAPIITTTTSTIIIIINCIIISDNYHWCAGKCSHSSLLTKRTKKEKA